ncbi:hypothetical protein GTQ34_02115 [Muricauda sp. JGD-17]|uniref:Uncharacterized protein n=1 Tax=Flagellimonas ochracea TaxID=2696472 RepID=A0A964T9G1_9FLAO|nr:hypothetical protein [Allomuricauda ochracea]NAY90702.1 hypothetical protein [Allomuricauda ochracea]
MSKIFKPIVLLAIALMIVQVTFSQNETLLKGVYFYESLAVIKGKVQNQALSHEVIIKTSPTFPLAKNSESHLLVTNLKTDGGTLGKAIFTFADDKLQYIEAHGNAIEVLLKSKMDSMQPFMHYKALFKQRIFADVEKDVVWMLTDESAHPNLFAWENPYLNEAITEESGNDWSAKIPDFIRMGDGLEKLRPILEAESSFVHEMELDGSDPNAQLQLDCYGIRYAGFPRKIEARFGDDKLNVVWILTGKGEEDRLRKKLIEEYGTPVFVTEAWEIFDDWTVGLRKDKPEILVMTPELGQFYKKEYFKQ